MQHYCFINIEKLGTGADTHRKERQGGYECRNQGDVFPNQNISNCARS